MDNLNSPEYLMKIKNQVIENLRRTAHAPSVQLIDVPRDPEGFDDEADAILDDLDEDENKDQRYTKRRRDKYIEKDGELDDSEDEGFGQDLGVSRHKSKRRNLMTDYPNPHAVPDDEEVVAAAARARSRSQNSDGNEENGVAIAAHGSTHSSSTNPDESGASTPKSVNESLPADDTTMQDADIEMGDDAAPPTTNGTHVTTEGPQEATPPASPQEVAAAPPLPSSTAAELGNDAMDEGDTLDDPELEKENGIMEREQEDVSAEKATEIAERSEEP